MTDSYYAPTAFDSSRPRHLPPADEIQFGAGMRTVMRSRIPNHGSAQCREFLTRLEEISTIDWFKSNTSIVKQTLAMPFHEIQYWETLKNPKVIVEVITKLLLILSICAWAWFLLFSIMALIDNFSWFLSKDFFSFLFGTSIPSIFYFLGKLLLKINLYKDKNNILFNRRKGTITIPRKKSPPLELPFDEFDGFMGATVNPSGSTDYHLILTHRYSASFVQHPGGGREPWYVNVEWEFWQQYMDISKPLPDVPSMEPYREKDPVTAEYDKKHNRPPRYWRDMDTKYGYEIQRAAMKAASTYPWNLTREQAMASGWQPSGFGEGNWKKSE